MAQQLEQKVKETAKPKAYVINLEHRTDRWESINKYFGETFELERFSAIEGRPGGLFCALSKIALIKKAKELDLPYMIMMEDDNYVTNKRFYDEWPKIYEWMNKNLENWDLINFNPTFLQKPKQVISTNPLLIEYGYGKTGNFIIYNRTTYDKMIALEPLYQKARDTNNFPYHQIASDHMMNMQGFKMVTHFPYFTAQLPDFSDIAQRRVDYAQVFQMSSIVLLNFLKGGHSLSP